MRIERRLQNLARTIERRLNALRPPTLYLRQGRVPSYVRTDDPAALADELAALRRHVERAHF